MKRPKYHIPHSGPIEDEWVRTVNGFDWGFGISLAALVVGLFVRNIP